MEDEDMATETPDRKGTAVKPEPRQNWRTALLLTALSVLTALSAGLSAACFSSKSEEENHPVLGLVLAAVCLCAIVGVVELAPQGKRRLYGANAGVMAAIVFVAAAIMWPVFQASRAVGARGVCVNNIKQLAIGLLTYASDYDDRLPNAGKWRTAIGSYTHESKDKPLFKCPEADSPYSYGFNKALSRVETSKVEDPKETVLVFEADAPSFNFAGGPREPCLSPRQESQRGVRGRSRWTGRTRD